MIVWHIAVRRTYNTGGYTSHSFEMQAELSRTDDVLDCFKELAVQLHLYALEVLAEQGIKEISEPYGKVRTPRKRSEQADEDEDEIPY